MFDKSKSERRDVKRKLVSFNFWHSLTLRGKQAFVIHALRFPKDRLMGNYVERFGLCFGEGEILWDSNLKIVGRFAYRSSSLARYHHANGEREL